MTNTNTLTHTPVSLLALHQQDPRKLDALAAEVVMGRIDVNSSKPQASYDENGYPMYYNNGFLNSFMPSTDLNHAALLEARLAERGLSRRLNAALFYDVLDVSPVDDNYEFNEDAVDKAIHATAADRTIAAILASQE